MLIATVTQLLLSATRVHSAVLLVTGLNRAAAC